MKNILVFQLMIIIGLEVSSCANKPESSEEIAINSDHSFIDLRPYSDLGTSIDLVDQHGNTFGLVDSIGNTSLLFFGYTFCPDFCPTTLSKITSVKNLLKTENEQLDIIFVSVDPQRDTPKILKEYLSYFPIKVYGLTGTIDAIDKTAAAFDVSFARGYPNEYGHYPVDHATSIYLLDVDQQVRYVFQHSTTASEIVSIIKTLWTLQTDNSMRLLSDDPLLSARKLGNVGRNILSSEEHEGYRLWSKRYNTLTDSKEQKMLQPSYKFQIGQ